MSRRSWTRLSPRARTEIIVIAIGFAVGAIFGDQLFVVVEEAIGDPWDELVFGIGGAAIALLGYEIVASFRKAA
jgi:hypothetical protein